MIKSIYNTARNMQYKMRDLEIVANNLANINSTGYKRELPFAEVLSRIENDRVKLNTDFNDGVTLETGNPYDFSISGNGFFTIQTEDGNLLTRNGRFHLSDEGLLVTDDGNLVLGQKGPIALNDLIFDPSKSIRVSKDGEIRIGDKLIDKFLIGSLDKNREIIRTGDQAFIYKDGEAVQADENNYAISQGFLEESNVNPILEMQAMIEINREFESSQKLISNFDQHLGRVNESGKI